MDSEQFHHEKGSSITTMNCNISSNTNLNGPPGANPSKSSLLCRQSSTRWIPAGEQVRILRDLYYNCGVRSPTADQIQKISARLRQYGKIEGKNVFYWFQNHKARERQKKRLTVDVPTTTKAASIISPGVPVACSSSPGLLYDAGHMGSSVSMLMDNNFRGCCISGGGDGMVTENSMSWMGFETPVMAGPWMCQYQQSTAVLDQEAAEMVARREIETLPLFPVHTEEQQLQEEEGTHDGFGHRWKGCNSYFPGFYWGGDQQVEMEGVMTGYNHQPWSSSSATSSAAARVAAASLELSLSSRHYGPPGST